jgi:hypothetical protein
MDAIYGLLNRVDESQTILMFGITVVSIVLSVQHFGLFNVLAAMAGRMHLKYLSQMPRDVSKKDATVSQIFVYPGRLRPDGFQPETIK